MIFFTSDWHLYHSNILKFNLNREFKTIEEMNQALIDNINERVGEEDTLYVLGDLAMDWRPVEIFTPQIKCRNLLLIPGNHDFCHTSHPKAKGEQKYMYQVNRYEELGWDVITQEQSLLSICEEITVRLHHLPYLNEDTKHENAHKSRYYSSYLTDDGLPLLHGHTHNLEKVRISKKGTPMIHVGVDAWDLKPAPETEILSILEGFYE